MATNLTPWNGLDVEKLKVWVHHILPLVYDDSLSYYEVLAKVGEKMNEVISGLNANNEQVEKVTGFTIEQVQNLTLAFNNFQQSMLTRQENFENKVLDSQQSFETQLKGDIAEWEATTEEKFRQQYEKDSTALNNAYAKFLSDYQKRFGVVQTTGQSITDVPSQKAWSDLSVVTKGKWDNSNNVNTVTDSGIWLVQTTSDNETVGVPLRNEAYVLVCYKYYTDTMQWLYAGSSERIFWRINLASEWIEICYALADTTGQSTTSAPSQKAWSDLSVVTKGKWNNSKNVNTATDSGIWLVQTTSDNDTVGVPLPNETYALVCYKYKTDTMQWLYAGNSERIFWRINTESDWIEKNQSEFGKETVWTIIGDSFTSQKQTDKYYYQYITDVYPNITVKNLSKPSAGYLSTTPEYGNFKTQVENIDVNSDVVTVFGSFNDISDINDKWGDPSTADGLDDTFSDAVYSTLQAIITKFVDNDKIPIIGVITPCPWEEYYPGQNTAEKYVDTLIAVCRRMGVPVYDFFHNSNFYTTNEKWRNLIYTNDTAKGSKIHPNALGHKIMASHIAQFLKSLSIKPIV